MGIRVPCLRLAGATQFHVLDALEKSPFSWDLSPYVKSSENQTKQFSLQMLLYNPVPHSSEFSHEIMNKCRDVIWNERDSWFYHSSATFEDKHRVFGVTTEICLWWGLVGSGGQFVGLLLLLLLSIFKQSFYRFSFLTSKLTTIFNVCLFVFHTENFMLPLISYHG